MKPIFFRLLKIVITFGLLAFLMWRINISAFLSTLKDVSVPLLMVAIAFIFLQPVLSAMRWHLIIRMLGLEYTLGRTLRWFYIGMFFSAVLPGGISGDGVRIWMMHRAGTKVSKALSCVMLDRLMALVGLVILVGLSLPFLNDQIADAFARYAIAALIMTGVAVCVVIGCSLRLPVTWRRFRTARALLLLSEDFRRLCLPPYRGLLLGAFTVFIMLCDSLKIFLLIRSLQNPVGFADCLTLGPLVILSMAVPISIGGWGLREGVMVLLFSAIGVPAAVSFAGSILLGALSLVASLPGGIIFLLRDDKRVLVPS